MTKPTAPERKLRYSVFSNSKDNKPRPHTSTYRELYDEFCKLQDHTAAKDGWALASGVWEAGAKRGNRDLIGCDLIFLDVDGGQTIEASREWVRSQGLGAIFYTTWSHQTGENPVDKYRLVLEASRTMASAEYRHIVGELAGRVQADESTNQPARLFYGPRAINPESVGERVLEFIDGCVFDVDAFLRQYPLPRTEQPTIDPSTIKVATGVNGAAWREVLHLTEQLEEAQEGGTDNARNRVSYYIGQLFPWLDEDQRSAAKARVVAAYAATSGSAPEASESKFDSASEAGLADVQEGFAATPRVILGALKRAEALQKRRPIPQINPAHEPALLKLERDLSQEGIYRPAFEYKGTTLIRLPPGSGKTHAILEELKARTPDSAKPSLFTVPTRKLGKEIESKGREFGLDIEVRLRRDETNCESIKHLHMLHDVAGNEVAQAYCRERCPHKFGCSTPDEIREQQKRWEHGGPAVEIDTHHGLAGRQGCQIVVEDGVGPGDWVTLRTTARQVQIRAASKGDSDAREWGRWTSAEEIAAEALQEILPYAVIILDEGPAGAFREEATLSHACIEKLGSEDATPASGEGLEKLQAGRPLSEVGVLDFEPLWAKLRGRDGEQKDLADWDPEQLRNHLPLKAVKVLERASRQDFEGCRYSEGGLSLVALRKLPALSETYLNLDGTGEPAVLAKLGFPNLKTQNAPGFFLTRTGTKAIRVPWNAGPRLNLGRKCEQRRFRELVKIYESDETGWVLHKAWWNHPFVGNLLAKAFAENRVTYQNAADTIGSNSFERLSTIVVFGVYLPKGVNDDEEFWGCGDVERFRGTLLGQGEDWKTNRELAQLTQALHRVRPIVHPDRRLVLISDRHAPEVSGVDWVDEPLESTLTTREKTIRELGRAYCTGGPLSWRKVRDRTKRAAGNVGDEEARAWAIRETGIIDLFRIAKRGRPAKKSG